MSKEISTQVLKVAEAGRVQTPRAKREEMVPGKRWVEAVVERKVPREEAGLNVEIGAGVRLRVSSLKILPPASRMQKLEKRSTALRTSPGPPCPTPRKIGLPAYPPATISHSRSPLFGPHPQG